MNPRTEPANVKVLLTTGEGLRIDWKDGHHSAYGFDYLRDQCPCATCRDTAKKPVSDLPLYKEKARATQAEPIGHYAFRFQFSDGHNTGIYSYEHLREICPCEDCRKLRAD